MVTAMPLGIALLGLSHAFLTHTTPGISSLRKQRLPLGALHASEISSSVYQPLEIVLFGIGDLRLDDHGGLQSALDTNNSVIPLCVLSNDMLSNIPGAIAHTADTSELLSAALTDLQSTLQNELGATLNVCMPSSLSQTLSDVVESLEARKVRVHLCDLGPVDNSLGYGEYAHIEPNTSWEIVPWNCHLRKQPWQSLALLPDTFTEYEALVQNETPSLPRATTRRAPNRFRSIPEYEIVPTSQQLFHRLQSILNLDDARCREEHNSGLYGTHWGGLSPTTIGESHAMKILTAFVDDCKERDDMWFQHPSFIGRHVTRNGRSLEHAAMLWQLQGDGRSPVGKWDNWLAGESMIRFLAAPLMFGTISPRRIWHSSTWQDWFFSSPMKRLVEAREWHSLLAARNLLTDEAYRGVGRTIYKYWRYHGFLCRYAETTFCNRQSRDGVLMVHGFGASGAQWNNVMHALNDMCETAFQGLAPDLIGFGQSEKPGISYTGYMWDAMVMDFCKEVAFPKNQWDSFVIGGNSIGGFTSMSLAASDSASVGTKKVTSSGAPGTNKCTGLVLMNSAGPLKSRDEIAVELERAKGLVLGTTAEATVLNALPPCKPPPRAVARVFGHVLLSYLRPRIQSICTNLYPTNPSALDGKLCDSILRDSLDPGAISVMMAGAKLPPPRSANELLQSDFGCASASPQVPESVFDGPVLIAQGVLDPLNNSTDRMLRFGALRDGITMDPIQAGHCPHDELPNEVARSISTWMMATLPERQKMISALVSGTR